MRDEYGAKRSRGIGKFFLGLFIGFLLTIGLLAGGIALVYFKASLSTFHVSTGNKVLDKYTMNDLVKQINKVVSNKNTVTLQDLGDTFGLEIPTDLMGIDITDLTSQPLMDIVDNTKEKFKTITADELSSVVNLSKLDNILGGTKTYYVSGSSLYTDEQLTQRVTDFKYTITSTTVTIKTHEEPIYDGHVDFETRYIPLTSAFGDIENFSVAQLLGYRVEGDDVFKGQEKITGVLKTLAKMTVGKIANEIENFTVADVLGYEIKEGKVYDGDIEVTGITKTISQYKVMELSSKIQTLTVADVLGYENRNGKIYDENGTEVDGLIASIGATKITEMSEEISSLTVAKVVGYTKVGNEWKDKDGNTVTGFMAYVAEKNINELSTIIDEVKVSDIMGYKNVDGVWQDKDGENLTGVMKLIAEKKVTELSSAFDELKVGDILGYTMNGGTVTDGEGHAVTGILKLLADKPINQLSNAVDDFTVKDILGYTNVDGTLQDSEGHEASAIMKLIADKKINELQSTIDGLTIGEVMGYKNTNGTYKDAEGNDVTGIMKALADTKFSDVGTKIESLTVTDVFDTSNSETNKILTLIDNNTKLTEIPSALSTAIQNKTMNDLVNAGILNIDSWEKVKDYKVGEQGASQQTLGDMKINDVLSAFIKILAATQSKG